MTWDLLQKEVSAWAVRNFGDTPAWMPMLGLVEEVGEYLAAEVVGNQAEMLDAIGDQTIYVLNLCEKVGIKFGDITGPPQELDAKELLGVLGVGCQAILKNAQAIRGFTWDKRRERMLVCLSMWHRWVASECQNYGMVVDLRQVVDGVWAKVKLRDWVKNPTDANLVGDGSQA